MARSESILAIDIGTASLKVGEFQFLPDGRVQLDAFAFKEYGEELTEGTRYAVVNDVLNQTLEENDFTTRRALLTVSGQSVFTRFVKLPPVAEEEGRVRQIVEFEARQNVPFPLEEVTWSYQLLSTEEEGELEVMFVVIKNEILEDFSQAAESAGLDLQVIDVAPAACYNAARASGIGDEECSLVLDIGCRSTNLLFADRTRFFARTIPIAGHSISQQIAKEFGIDFDEAEELKRRHGFVALGGAYEEPESEVAASVSKIVRNVMTRLHGEVNRSINVYCSQKNGNRPVRFYLTGGSSIMPYTDRFFAEKLNMEVDYFNPFQGIMIGPNVDRQSLQESAHMFSQTVGLALRYRSQCPVEVSLIPKVIRQQKLIEQKKYYFAGALSTVVLMLLFSLLGIETRRMEHETLAQNLSQEVDRLQGRQSEIQSVQSRIDRLKRQEQQLTELFQKRTNWPEVLNELAELTPENLWIDEITPLSEVEQIEEEAASAEAGTSGSSDPFSGGSSGSSSGGGTASSGGGMVGLRLTGRAATVRPVVAETAGTSAPAEGMLAENDDQESESNDASENDSSENEDKPGENAPLEERFVYNLRQSSLFADSGATGILSYTSSEEFNNMSSFEIQVKFEESIEAITEQENQSGSSGRGAR